jgi:hypothetical protein
VTNILFFPVYRASFTSFVVDINVLGVAVEGTGCIGSGSTVVSDSGGVYSTRTDVVEDGVEEVLTVVTVD